MKISRTNSPHSQVAALFAINPWASVACGDNDAARTPDAAFATGRHLTRARRSAAHSRLASGVDAWNRWAHAMLDLKRTIKGQVSAPKTWSDLATIDFAGADFCDVCDFSGFVFPGLVDFSHARFAQDAWFIVARFMGGADFCGAIFGRDAFFERAEFSETTRFDRTKWIRDAQFRSSKFNRDASFRNADFGKDAWFVGSNFAGALSFSASEFAGERVLANAPAAERRIFPWSGSGTMRALRRRIFTGRFGSTEHISNARHGSGRLASTPMPHSIVPGLRTAWTSRTLVSFKIPVFSESSPACMRYVQAPSIRARRAWR
jgi:uncharacterized protein YjbI with pentapeptide repeats